LLSLEQRDNAPGRRAGGDATGLQAGATGGGGARVRRHLRRIAGAGFQFDLRRRRDRLHRHRRNNLHARSRRCCGWS